MSCLPFLALLKRGRGPYSSHVLEMQALWAACQRYATERSRNDSPGTSASLHIRRVEAVAEVAAWGATSGEKSATSKGEGGEGGSGSAGGEEGAGAALRGANAVVVALGAGYTRLLDIPTGCLPPISLSRGHVLELHAPHK